MCIILYCWETAGDDSEFAKSHDGANRKSSSGFESASEVVEGMTILPLIPYGGPDKLEAECLVLENLAKLMCTLRGREDLLGRKSVIS
jgi:hypothetical protein